MVPCHVAPLADDVSPRFRALMTKLVREKGRLDDESLLELAMAMAPVNPIHADAPGFTSTERLVFGKAFADLLRLGVRDWESVRQEAASLLAWRRAKHETRDDARESTEWLVSPRVVAHIPTPHKFSMFFGPKDGLIEAMDFFGESWGVIPFDTRTGTAGPLREVRADHEGSSCGVVTMPDGRHLGVSYFRDTNQIKVIDTASNADVGTYAVPPIENVDILRFGAKAGVSKSGSVTVRFEHGLFDTADAQLHPIPPAVGRGWEAEDVRISVRQGTMDFVISDPLTGKEIYSKPLNRPPGDLPEHDLEVAAAKLPGGKYLAAVRLGNIVHVVDTSTGKRFDIPAEGSGKRFLQFAKTPKGWVFVAEGDKALRGVRLWDESPIHVALPAVERTGPTLVQKPDGGMVLVSDVPMQSSIEFVDVLSGGVNQFPWLLAIRNTAGTFTDATGKIYRVYGQNGGLSVVQIYGPR